MEIEGFSSIISTLTLAKELHDIGRFDVVRHQFFDALCCDSYYENMFGVIMSVFSGFYSDYDSGNEVECMIFSDDCISRYFEIAREYGRRHNIRHDDNPFVIEAEDEVRKQLSFCFSLDWKLLGYTKNKKTVKQSKLIVYIGSCDCECHDHLAYGLIQLYKFFTDKCAEFENRNAAMMTHTDNMSRKEMRAA